MIYTKAFWKATGERAVKTLAQVLAGVSFADVVTAGAVGWRVLLISAGSATFASVLTSIVSAGGSATGSPSALDAEVLPPVLPDKSPIEYSPEHGFDDPSAGPDPAARP